MTNQERIDSILKETEYGFIGYSNLHDKDDDGVEDQGLRLIEKALKRMLPMKPKDGKCPVCGYGLAKFKDFAICMNGDCLQKIEVEI